MNKWLAHIYRYAARGDDFMSTLGEEIDCAQSYIELQRKRYKSKIDFEVSLEEQDLKMEIPKCILQPLVENAIVHGIGNSKRELLIKIYMEKSNNVALLLVEDNGQGCDTHLLNQYLAGEEGLLSSEKIGIKNVNERIKLKFGEVYGLETMTNNVGGVTVIINLPK